MKQLNYDLYDDEVMITQFGTFAYITDYSDGYAYCLRVVLRDVSFQWFDHYTRTGILDLTGEDNTMLFTLGR